MEARNEKEQRMKTVSRCMVFAGKSEMEARRKAKNGIKHMRTGDWQAIRRPANPLKGETGKENTRQKTGDK